MGLMPRTAVSARVLGDFQTDRRVLLLTVLAVPIGAIGAVVAKVLLWLIAVMTNAAFFGRFSSVAVEAQNNRLGPWVIGVPVAGAIVIGLMARYGSEKIRGHGIPEALEAILLGRSLISPKVAILKPISSAISIGTGGPFGAEGPIIMTGGALGSLFAQLFSLTGAERKTLLVAGAVAGMSAVFATPLAAVLLGVELLLFEWKPRSFIPVATAALVASVARVPLLGGGPLFLVNAHASPSATMFLFAVFAGAVAGLGSGLMTAMVYGCEDLFAKLPIHWMWWPALGAVVVGIGGYIDPRVLGVGYSTIDNLVRGDLIGVTLISLVLIKGFVWAIALGSGTSGGVLAPLLIIGGALGSLLATAFGAGVGEPGLWAMVGMSAMMAGTMRSPLTGTVFVVELTHDFNALPLLLVGSVSALCVTVLLLRRSILTEKLARRGQHIAREYSVDLFEQLLVGDVMDKVPPVVSGQLRLSELDERIRAGDSTLSRRHAFIVVDAQQQLLGIITRTELTRAREANVDAPLQDIANRDVVTATAGQTLQDAIAQLMHKKISRLVVVDSLKPERVVGYLGQSDILSARARRHREEAHRERGAWVESASKGWASRDRLFSARRRP